LQDPIFAICWQTLSRVGWTSFSFQDVIEEGHPFSLEFLVAHFPSKEDLVLYFMRSISAQLICDLPNMFPYQASLREYFFEGIMARLEAFSAHRPLIIDLILWGPTSLKTRMIQHLTCDFLPYFFPKRAYFIPPLFLGLYWISLQQWATQSDEIVMIHLDSCLHALSLLYPDLEKP
jgi:hypothetical protein